MSNIVLIQPPIRDFYLTQKRTIPYGLASIAGTLRRQGFDVDLFDALASKKAKKIPLPRAFSQVVPFYAKTDLSLFSLFHQYKHFGYSFEHIGKFVKDKHPFLVGISSLFTPYCNQALKTAEMVKKFYPDCKIVLGGHHPTLFAETVLQHPAVDFVLQGEGECSMPLLAKALKNKMPLEDIPGIALKRADGSLFLSEPAWMEDLNDYGNPAMDLINTKFYQRNNKGTICVVASRGCPMKCSYCSVSASSNHGPFRQRQVKSIIDEIQSQLKFNDIGFIDFEDENLSLNKKWFLSLLQEIQTLFAGKKLELRAMNGLYPPAIDEEIVLAMKKTGFKTLNLSLGSTAKAQLSRFRRHDVKDDYEKAVFLARKYGLQTVSYIIAAACGQEAQTTIDDLLYLAEKPTLAGLSIFYPAPGSLDFALCKEKNLLPDHFSLMRSSAFPISDQTTRIEAITLMRLSRILNFMKHLKDTGCDLPEAQPCSQDSIHSQNDRQAVSIKLLAWFLFDGVIRGVEKNGVIYEHIIDLRLSRSFIEQLDFSCIKGITCGAT
ncbi:MAG: radical SAM protein [Desulfobacteraceae bacterium]|nr:radical SAM protein [Desulfobacteraceae bacterium]